MNDAALRRQLSRKVIRNDILDFKQQGFEFILVTYTRVWAESSTVLVTRLCYV